MKVTSTFWPLPCGETFIRRSVPEGTVRGVVVLVHGFSAPLEVWGELPDALVRHRLEVLAYDLLGRGRSAAPSGRYDVPRWADQLEQVLDAAFGARPVILVGLSMGGPVATTVAVRRPHQVRRVVLVDPLVLPLTLPRRWRWLIRPFVGEFLMTWRGPHWLFEGLRADFVSPERLPDALAQAYRAQLRRPGVRRALLATLRAGTLTRDYRPLYRQAARLGVPGALVWGAADPTIPPTQADALREVWPLPLHWVPDAGHLPHLEGGLETVVQCILA